MTLRLARLESALASAAAQYHSKTCTASDAAEEKDNAADTTHNGDGGDNSERDGLRRTGRRPGRQRGRGGTEEGRRSVHQILGEFGHDIAARDSAAVDRKALQKGELAAARLPLIHIMARVALPQWRLAS